MGEAGRYAQRRACGQAAAPRLERRCPQQVDSADLCPGSAAAPCTPLASLHPPGTVCSRGAPRPAGPWHHALLQRSATAPGPRRQHGGGSMAAARGAALRLCRSRSLCATLRHGPRLGPHLLVQ